MDSTLGGSGTTGGSGEIPHRQLRDETEAELIRAVGRGQLDLGTFSELSAAVWAAENPDDIRAIVPRVAAPIPDRAGFPAPARKTITAVLGDVTRRGAWCLPRELRIHPLLGDVTLDLRETTMESNSCRITLMGLFGDCTMIIPEGVSVSVTTTTILGDIRIAETGRPRGPEIEVGGFIFGGDIKVKTLAPGQSAGSGGWFDFLR